MSNIPSIFEAIQYIETNLQEEITIADVADKICYSLYHFCRMFNKATYHTPYEYIMKRRLSESALELVNSDKLIIDIAYDYQFNNPESYSRAFKRMFKTQPSKFRKHGILDGLGYMPALTLDYLIYINSSDFLLPEISEEFEPITIAGYTALINRDKDILSELWKILKYDCKKYSIVKDNSTFYAFLYYPDETNRKKFFYSASIKIEDKKSLENTPLQLIIIPYRKFIKLIHKGNSNELLHLLNFFYHTWRNKSKEKVLINYEIECYYNTNIDSILSDTMKEVNILIPIDEHS